MPIFAPNKLQRDAKLRLVLKGILITTIFACHGLAVCCDSILFSELTKQTVDEHQGISNMCGKFQQKMQRAGNL
jgi:hypothetical protein